MFSCKHIFFKFLSNLQGFQMGIVGANQWKGGYLQYTGTESSFEPLDMEADSYLGKK